MGKRPCSFLKIGRLFAQSACSCPTSRSSDIAAPAHGLNNIRVVKSTEVARVPSGEKRRRGSWLIRRRDVRIPAALVPIVASLRRPAHGQRGIGNNVLEGPRLSYPKALAKKGRRGANRQADSPGGLNAPRD